MERDFLGLMSSSSKDVCIDHGFKGIAGMQWGGLSNNKVSSLSHFMPFKPIPKEGPTKVSSSSAFHSYGSTQKSFSRDRQSAHFSIPGCAVHAAGLNEMRTFPPVFNHSIPMAKSNPFIKIHGGITGTHIAPTSVKQQKEAFSIMGSSAGTNAPSISKTIPASAQLTIFYGGVVNVFDEVPLEKAQAIMFLAGNGSSMTANAAIPRTTQVQAMSPKPAVADGVRGNQSRATSPRSSLSSPTSVTSHMGAQLRSRSISTDDLVGGKALEGGCRLTPKAITSMESVFGTEMSDGIPIARKASLARFFEKRKERVTNASPYFMKSQHFEKHVTSFPSSW
ncbi:hypothetical protein MRB53_030005 [Persea americana]|uniref:Uncharacterized protein n=1 Tax=Persea americana TaxID=3435 RepID=A0ACC2KJZ3_PERAE|nr:hypothetical protein MRB53_030005 [Persea americana]